MWMSYVFMDICVCARMNGYVDVSWKEGGYITLYLGRGMGAVRELWLRVSSVWIYT